MEIMEIDVNHVTRMQPGYVCIAGLDRGSGRHVRPVLRGVRLGERLLRQNGGPFEMATRVDLGPTQPAGAPPETEDWAFDPRFARVIEAIDPDEFWRSVRSVAASYLVDLFGEDLKPQGHTFAVDIGRGSASLGCLAPARASLYVDVRGTLRIALDDARMQPILPVTDLRFYERDFRTVRRDAVRGHAERLRRGVPVILSVGLTRPWQRPGDAVARHWLQVNNLHLEDDPAWQGTS
jgi:hypothetical protein